MHYDQNLLGQLSLLAGLAWGLDRLGESRVHRYAVMMRICPGLQGPEAIQAPCHPVFFFARVFPFQVSL